MREILFRGWISKSYAGEEKPVLVTQENDSDCFLISNGSGFSIVDGNHNYIPKEHITVQQFTGLIDKNGVKIFEGDIVSVDGGYSGDSHYKQCRASVIFEDGCFCLHTKENVHGVVMQDWHWEDLEVVGNIIREED